jgi:hypothetical protein
MNELYGYNFKLDLTDREGYITSGERDLTSIWKTRPYYHYNKHSDGKVLGVYLLDKVEYTDNIFEGIVVAPDLDTAKSMLNDFKKNNKESKYYIPEDHENMTGRDLDREERNLEIKNIMGESLITKTLSELKSQTQMVIKESLLKESFDEVEIENEVVSESGDEMTPEREEIKKELLRLFTEARLNKNDVIVNQKITKIIDKLAKAWNVETSVIEDELKLGVQIEKEHNEDVQFKKIIALQHINESLTYYTDSKPENWAEKEIAGESGEKPVNESIKRLFKNKDRIVSLF